MVGRLIWIKREFNCQTSIRNHRNNSNLGQFTGGTQLVVKGVRFKDNVHIKVRIILGKNYSDVSGVYVSESELSWITLNFEHIKPKEWEVRTNIQGGDFKYTFLLFSFFMNTKEHKWLAYGPGLLEGGAIGSPTEFIIQARGNHDENRTSGRDHFIVEIVKVGEEKSQLNANL